MIQWVFGGFYEAGESSQPMYPLIYVKNIKMSPWSDLKWELFLVYTINTANTGEEHDDRQSHTISCQSWCSCQL